MQCNATVRSSFVHVMASVQLLSELQKLAVLREVDKSHVRHGFDTLLRCLIPAIHRAPIGAIHCRSRFAKSLRSL